MNIQKTPFSKLSGARVVLTRDIETRGGEKFSKGQEFIIVQKYKGLTLALPETPEKWAIRKVGYDAVMLAPSNQTMQPTADSTGTGN